MAYTTYNDAWYHWTATSCTSSTSSTTSCGDVWSSWNTSTATTTASGDATWIVWNNSGASQPTARPESEFVRQRREQSEQARQAHWASEKRYAEIQRKRETAEKKAQQLLMDLIGPEQLEVYKETGRLYVRGNQHDYILKKGGLVTQVGKDKVIDMCVHLAERSSFPETDNVVGLKLMLESEAERKVLKLANYHAYSERLRDKAELPLAACM